MGPTETKSLTQSGLRYICRYFILNLFFILALLLFSVTLFIGGESWLKNQGSTLTFVAIVVFIAIIILLWLIIGLANIFNGRKEFDTKHEPNVILATILLIVYITLFLVTLVYSKGFTGGRAFISAASIGFSSQVLELIVTLVLSIASHIIFGLAMAYLVKEVSSDDQKKRLRTALYLLVAGNFTLNITGLIAYFMFFKIYQEIYLSFKEGKIKAAVTAPCPQCDKDIPVESDVCPHCGTKFDKSAPIKIDPRLTMDAPKSEYTLPPGYAPIKGPTEAQKKKLFRFVKIIIAIIIAIVVVYIIYIVLTGIHGSTSVTGIDKSNFIGTWNGGMFNGTTYIINEKWTFYDNDSLKKEDSTNNVSWYTYEISNQELCIRDPEIHSLMCYDVEFSNGNTQFSLFLSNMIMYQFTKV